MIVITRIEGRFAGPGELLPDSDLARRPPERQDGHMVEGGSMARVLKQGQLFELAPAASSGEVPPQSGPLEGAPLHRELARYAEFGSETQVLRRLSADGRCSAPAYINEFWTRKQRAGDSLHELSYRACFKPQLPRFFVQRLSKPGDLIYDPFMGRGTTLLEAALLGRRPIGNDINPLSERLLRPRLEAPELVDVAARLADLDLSGVDAPPEDLLTFFHRDTLTEICALRRYLQRREVAGELDACDGWIRMVAVNRLTGHSPGFFSVYTMPPNQAVSVKAQRKINARRDQVPPRRDVRALIMRKSRSLLSRGDPGARRRLAEFGPQATYLCRPADSTAQIESGSVRLVITSPPFLDVVQYQNDNWLRCWFCGIDMSQVSITMLRKIEDWQAAMTAVFCELARVLKPDGHIAFEVGEVRGGSVQLDEVVLCCGLDAGLVPELVLVNEQQFTKTANCWGVSNNKLGTNSNRVVLFRKLR